MLLCRRNEREKSGYNAIITLLTAQLDLLTDGFIERNLAMNHYKLRSKLSIVYNG